MYAGWKHTVSVLSRYAVAPNIIRAARPIPDRAFRRCVCFRNAVRLFAWQASSALPDPPVRIRETENIESCGGFCRRADVGRAEVFPAFLEGNMFRYVSAPAGALRKSLSVDEKRRDGSLSAMVSFRAEGCFRITVVLSQKGTCSDFLPSCFGGCDFRSC